MIENNSMPVAVPPGASLGFGSPPSVLPSGITPPHMMLGRSTGGQHEGRAPMKEYIDRVADRKKWEDVCDTVNRMLLL